MPTPYVTHERTELGIIRARLVVAESTRNKPAAAPAIRIHPPPHQPCCDMGGCVCLRPACGNIRSVSCELCPLPPGQRQLAPPGWAARADGLIVVSAACLWSTKYGGFSGVGPLEHVLVQIQPGKGQHASRGRVLDTWHWPNVPSADLLSSISRPPARPCVAKPTLSITGPWHASIYLTCVSVSLLPLSPLRLLLVYPCSYCPGAVESYKRSEISNTTSGSRCGVAFSPIHRFLGQQSQRACFLPHEHFFFFWIPTSLNTLL